MWRLSKHAALFAVGAIAYFEIELHWRYFAGTLPVHWTMPILGGVLFLLLGGLLNDLEFIAFFRSHLMP